MEKLKSSLGREYEMARSEFAEHIATKDPKNRAHIVEGWLKYKKVLGSLRGGKVSENDLEDLNQVIEGITLGLEIDFQKAAWAHTDFAMETYVGMRGVGSLFKGLGTGLPKATEFCRAMDAVGRRTGDIDHVYPLVDATLELLKADNSGKILRAIGNGEKWVSEKSLFEQLGEMDQRLMAMFEALLALGIILRVETESGAMYDVSKKTRILIASAK